MSPYLHKYAPTDPQTASQDGGDDGDATARSPSSAYAMSEEDSRSPRGSAQQVTGLGITTPTPVTEAVLTQHLATLKNTLTATITDTVAQALATLKTELMELGNRTDKIETTVDDITQSHNELLEENLAIRAELNQIKILCEDLENRNRRSNIRIRGIPETIKQPDLKAYLRNLFSTLVPDLPPEAWRLDRAHRALGNPPPNSKLPKDVVTKLHYFESKDRVISATRMRQNIEHQGAQLQLYNDISSITLAKRRALRPITQILRDNKIPYRWGYPFKLIATKDGRQYTLVETSQQERFLIALGIAEKPPALSPTTSPTRNKLQPIWETTPKQGRQHKETESIRPCIIATT